MSYRQINSPDRVVLEPGSPATASVIWLHGLGADGHDFVPIVPELRLPASLAIRFVFPHAPHQPVSINNGYVMPAWYDIRPEAPDDRSTHEDEAGIRASEQRVRALIEAEHAQGIPFNKIVIAGFSQGGAVSLQTALRYPEALAGVMPLSTYLPLRNTVAAEASAANRQIPIFMCHGRQDPILPLSLGQQSAATLRAAGYSVDFREYPMPHSVCADEVRDISRWLQERLA